jgi:hypothetical protein
MSIILEIEKQIEALEQKKADIQNKCSHPSVKKVGRGDEGNILTGRDPSYWTQCTCELCGLRWNE